MPGSRILPLTAVGLLILLAGCRKPEEKHYSLSGEVISVDPAHKTVAVKHGDIPGLMPAMTMEYDVADPHQLEGVQPGDTVSADLVVADDKGRLEKIVLVKKGNGKTTPGATQHIPQKGDTVPNFALINQDGHVIHLHDFSGKVVLLTFIYTRCPLPDFCPRMNHNFQEVQKQLSSSPAALDKTVFLSVSFDPAHDTPAALKQYAAAYRRSVPAKANWIFAVPTVKNLPEIAQFFGLAYEPDQDQIVHSLSTTVIAPDEKIALWDHSNEWSPQEMARTIASVVGQS